MEYLAHISDDKTRKQTVLEHSQNVAMLAKQYADVFEAGSWGYCCGETHDIGKYSDEFQERLKGGKLVDHATASAKELIARGGMYSLAAYITAGHHAGYQIKVLMQMMQGVEHFVEEKKRKFQIIRHIRMKLKLLN